MTDWKESLSGSEKPKRRLSRMVMVAGASTDVERNRSVWIRETEVGGDISDSNEGV